MLFKIIVGVIVVSANVATRREHNPLRVYKGEADSGNEFPFVVLFQKKKPPYFRVCTGSLITETLVLTASHCLTVPNVRQCIIRYGDFTVPGNETKLYSKIIKAFVPRSVKEFRRIIDIGIALVKKIPNPRAKLLALDYKTLYGLPAKYAGFGRITDLGVKPDRNEGYNLSSVPLQVGEGIIVPCTNGVIPVYTVCVASKCSKRWQATRKGDSGGPLVYNGRIVGVVRGATYGPTVSYTFSLVSSYLEWIQGVMRFTVTNKNNNNKKLFTVAKKKYSNEQRQKITQAQ
ncbi:chymotrypsin-2-like [Cydia pomonella]|uniref:chymotrypsin-2-like n=1 Tax=Cydia pomonella TaxID=82600 RepID=UPI002ADE3491|nr:chymotrypsin-2-like [Cydia pomonella]